MSELPFAHGGPPLLGRLRLTPEDFIVEERLGFEASGAGEHWLLHVEKRSANTVHVAKQLARFAQVDVRDVGYAGLKDRHAITRQYFSVRAQKGVSTDWAQFDCEGVRVLQSSRHARKLQRGAHRGNRFDLHLREIEGDPVRALAVLAAIARDGVPNYFGEQRFGREGDNVAQARAMFAGQRVERHERSILISAARSELFNRVLAERVASGQWNQALEGDVFQLDGRSAIFGPEPLDGTLFERVSRAEIHPTGPLFGRGDLRVTEAAAALERAVLDADQELCQGLIHAGLEQERRSLRLMARSFEFAFAGADCLRLSFELPPGAFATVVVRELMEARV